MSVFVKRNKTNRQVKGVYRGNNAPVLDQANENEFVEITETEYADLIAKQNQAIIEHRVLQYDSGVVLGDAPANVAKIDLDGPSVLLPGDTATITLELLGDGNLTINLNGQNVTLRQNQPIYTVTLTAS